MMALDNHLTDIFNKLNKDIDKVIETSQKNDGKLVVYPGGVNNGKQRLKTLFGLRSQYFHGIDKEDFANNEKFQEFYDGVKERGYRLSVEEVKQPVNYAKNLLTKASVGIGGGALLWKIGFMPFLKIAGVGLMVGGLGLTGLKMSNVGKAKVTFDIYKPEI